MHASRSALLERALMTAWRGVAQRAAAAAAQLDAPALRAPCRIHAMPVTHMATKGLCDDIVLYKVIA